MSEKAKVYALRTFSSKDKNDQYFVADCLLSTQLTTPRFTGLNQVTVYLDSAQYNGLLSRFQPMMDVSLEASLFGNRVSYALSR